MCLHKYNTVRETASGWLEVCERCGKRNTMRRSKLGKIDDKKFLREHRRDFLQATWPQTAKEFEKEYGKPDIKKHIAPKKKTQKQLAEELMIAAEEGLREYDRPKRHNA